MSPAHPPEPLPRLLLLALLVGCVALVAVLVQGEIAGHLQKAERAAAGLTDRDPARYLERARAARAHTPLAILALAPLAAAALAGFSPRVVRALRYGSLEGLALLGGLLAAWPAVVLGLPRQASADGFDPYQPLLLAAGGAAAVVAAGRQQRLGRELGGLFLALWLLLWVPFDLRWYKSLEAGLPGLGLEYEGFALAVTAVGLLAFFVAGRLEVGARPPKKHDLIPAVVLLLGFGLIALPIGLGTGFLELSAPKTGLVGFVGGALVIALTVALPEELFFRGLLDQRLQDRLGGYWTSLLLSSFLFGLMHWNNRDDFETRLLYLLLATVAGIFYGAAYRMTRGLWAPVLVHTLVDVIWQVFLRG